MKLIKTKINKYIEPIKYIIVAGICFIFDQLLFNIIMYFLVQNKFIMLSKILSRIFSSILNYLLNSNVVFKKRGKNSVIKYYILVLIQVLISGVSIYIFKTIFDGMSVMILSALIDIVIFIVNYIVQKYLIFK